MADLTALSATTLSNMLARREASSAEIVRAHLDRIEALDGKLKAFTQVFRRESLEAAERADRARARGEAKGPLYGLPITVKESVDMMGQASTLGVVARASLRSQRDGAVVQAIEQAGAIVIGRTNVSQFLMFHESRNPLFGQTANPWSLDHTPGGSSGGEGTAIAAGMSVLGIGTDIGGSIRVPAHFCGIAGLKPTLDRWSNRGSNTGMMGQEAIRGQIGPMARTVDDLTLLMRGLDPYLMSELDPRVPSLPPPDPDKIDISGLKIGLFPDDGILPPSMAVLRTIDRAATALRARGCQVVPFTVPDAPAFIDRYFAAMSADGGHTVERVLAGGTLDPVLEALFRIAKLPNAARKAASRVAALVGERRVARLLDQIGEKSVSTLWKLTDEIRGYRYRVLDAMEQAGISAILSTAHATPALPHMHSKDFLLAGSGSMIWNLLQFPAGVVPVTRVRPDEARRTDPRDKLEKLAAEVDRRSTGLPLGVQVSARPWHEDVVLAVMREIESEVRDDEGFPRTPHCVFETSR